MALRTGKRKAPRREDKQVKERNMIAGGVFEDKTVDVLVNLLNAKVIDSLDYPVSGGKEAIVFRATRGAEYRAVKVFKYENTSFRTMFEYVDGDPRFHKPSRQRRSLVRLWARKEFANLSACRAAGVLVPEPFACRENVLVMQFLGVGGVQSALLSEVVLDDAEKTFETVARNMEKMFGAGIVHADLSEYNVIMHKGEPYFIDLAQGVSLKHPRALQWLEKDVHNVVRYFKKLGVKADEANTLKKIVSRQ